MKIIFGTFISFRFAYKETTILPDFKKLKELSVLSILEIPRGQKGLTNCETLFS